MREIKFRAWDLEDEEMIPWNRLHLETDEYGIYRWKYTDGGPFSGSGCGTDDFELMQYTGLKDKIGTEIYEGDIVEVKYSKDGQVTIKENCKVVFKEQAFGVDGYGSSKEFVPFRAFHGFKFGIVGNVYENPEWGIEI